MTAGKLVSWLLLPLLAILLIVMNARKVKDVKVVDEKWACRWVVDKAECNIAFTIQNRTDRYHDVNLSIWGHQRRGGAGRGARLETVGVSTMTFRMEPHEDKGFNEVVMFSRTPDVVQLHANSTGSGPGQR